MAAQMVELKVEPRTVRGKKVRHLRKRGLIPGHVYGHGRPSDLVQVETRALQQVLARVGVNSLVTLVSSGKTRTALLRGVARDPVTHALSHVDLQEVLLDEPVRAYVPLVLSGESPAAKGDVVVLRPVDHLLVEALPTQLPHTLPVDLSKLTEPGQSIHVGDLELPAGVRVLDEPTTVVATLSTAVAEEEVVAPPAEEGAAERPAAERTEG